MNNEWKWLKTIADIPEPKTWDQYEWRGDVYMLSSNVTFEPTDIHIKEDGTIGAYEELNEYCAIGYRPKPIPSDEWIKARLWRLYANDDSLWVNFNLNPDYTHGDDISTEFLVSWAQVRWSRARKWFLSAQWVLKDIHEGYKE